MFTKKGAVLVASTIFCLSTPLAVLATDNSAQVENASGGVKFGMAAGVEAWSGDITYQIGYPVSDAYGYIYNGYFPFSELSFPLDVAFGTVEADLTIIDKYVIGLKLKKNISDPDDYMEDRDWITSSDPSRLDIYSDSTVTDFSAFVIDVDLNYRIVVNDRVSFGAGIGYMHQDFEYETALIRQWSPSGLMGFDYVGDGTTSLIYEVEIDMPYLEVSGHFNILPSLFINGRFAYAPWVSVDDKDQHLLRNKVNTGDLSGSAVMFSGDVEYDFTPQFFVTGGFDYTYIKADGDMDATFYGIYDHTVAEELESDQFVLYATVGFRFGAPANQ